MHVYTQMHAYIHSMALHTQRRHLDVVSARDGRTLRQAAVEQRREQRHLQWILAALPEEERQLVPAPAPSTEHMRLVFDA